MHWYSLCTFYSSINDAKVKLCREDRGAAGLCLIFAMMTSKSRIRTLQLDYVAKKAMNSQNCHRMEPAHIIS